MDTIEFPKFKIAVSDYKLDKKLMPGDSRWHAFNASFRNLELETAQIMDMIYFGRAITTQHRNHWRTSANYLCGQHIGLDFDTEDARSTLDYLAKDKFISRYAAFIHTTISHKPDAPRARVIFLLDQPIVQAKNYVLAASALLWVFGTADRQCKDAARFFYGAPNCEAYYINQVLPLEVVKKMIANYQETGACEKKRATRPDYLPPASQKEVSEALKMIPPWGIDYDDWLRVLMAIHSQFGDAGLSLAENWADGKPGEVERKWKSFKESGNATGAVTIATLFEIAKRHGWNRGSYGER